MIDPSKLSSAQEVKCRFTPRTEYAGRELKSGLENLYNKTLHLRGLWLMDENDPYPDEWALGDVLTSTVLEDVGLAWIASGDVTLIEP